LYAPHRSLSTTTAPPASYTLSLHDALPISLKRGIQGASSTNCMALVPVWKPETSGIVTRKPTIAPRSEIALASRRFLTGTSAMRSEEHTSELQSRGHLVCRLLLEKKKKNK